MVPLSKSLAASPPSIAVDRRLDVVSRLLERVAHDLADRRFVVGERRDAVVVPDAAVLRDDVSGVSRIAVVAGRKLHWIQITSGLRQDGFTEISGATLPAEGQAVVSGMIGLPEGKSVAIQK